MVGRPAKHPTTRSLRISEEVYVILRSHQKSYREHSNGKYNPPLGDVLITLLLHRETMDLREMVQQAYDHLDGDI
jgi:hypothetical protein